MTVGNDTGAKSLSKKTSVNTFNNRSITRKGTMSTLESQTDAQLPLRFAHVVLVFIALCLLSFLSSLETTIVSTATPEIVSSLGGLNQVSWMANAYILTSTISLPIVGRLSDTFGRLPVTLAASLTFMAGNALCGAAQSMDMLISARALAGIGGGCLGALNFVIASDIVSLKYRSLFQGLAAAVFAISSVVGPILGGVFTDGIGWRWIFYLNLPIGAIAILILIIWLRLPPRPGSVREKLKRIDYLGSLFIGSATVCLLLATSWGGQDYEWSSPLIIILFILSGLLAIVFCCVEFRFAIEPIMPRRLFRHRNVGISFIHHFLFGIPFMVTMFYMPVWFQVVHGDSATRSGVKIIPMVLSSSLVSVAVSATISMTGYTVPFTALGSVGMTIGMSLFGTLDAQSSEVTEICYMVIAGVSAGLVFQPMLFSAQVATHRRDTGVTTTLCLFFRYIGSIIGIALCGAIFNNIIIDELYARLPDSDPQLIQALRTNMNVIMTQPDNIRTIVVDSFVKALNTTFFVCACFPALMFLSCLPMDKRRLTFARKAIPRKPTHSTLKQSIRQNGVNDVATIDGAYAPSYYSSTERQSIDEEEEDSDYSGRYYASHILHSAFVLPYMDLNSAIVIYEGARQDEDDKIPSDQ